MILWPRISRSNEFNPGEQAETWSFGMADSGAKPPDAHSDSNHQSIDNKLGELEDIPIILWWTERLYPHVNKWDILTCPKGRCYVTNRRKYANHSQTTAFYFYGTEFLPRDLPLPRKQRHLWALAHEESPLNNFVLDHAVGMNLFNYTATYHRAADFPISTLSFPGVDFVLNRKPYSTAEKNYFQKVEGFAPAIYVQSHCEVPSDRDRYIEELMAHVKVDSFGEFRPDFKKP